MKYLIILLFSSIIFSSTAAQELGYEIMPTSRKGIKKDALSDATKLSDINPDFPTTWINKYHLVKITATCGGNTISIESENDQLNKSQIQALSNADLGSDINVTVKYNPKNSTEENIREINFTYTIVPETEARFTEDYQDLKAYIKTHVIDKLSEDKLKNIKNATVRFTIDEEGNSTNTIVEISTKFNDIDQLLIDMITDMPAWKPAAVKDGSNVKQDFILNVGSMIGC
ncbi:MAG: hypothetical protein ACJA1A_002357 [Saprospiraceae bacterium]|jgi:hypothetical protein|tara:strand:+ start:228 stop:914 length:687 start_codon:yes stop_codon:yes gene_type:complete